MTQKTEIEEKNQHPFEKLQQRASDAEARLKQANALSSEINPDIEETKAQLSKELESDNPILVTNKKTVATTLVFAEIEKHLHRGETMGLFDSHAITPSGEFPSLLCRLPIFMPSSRARQKELLDDDLALEFETPFGKGRRLGPPLTVFDEDVLLAIVNLRTKRLTGLCKNLPLPISHMYARTEMNNDATDLTSVNVQVDTVVCTTTHILDELELSDGGKNYSNVLSSLKRLAATTLEIEVTSQNRYFGGMDVGFGKPVRLIDIEWVAFDNYGIVSIQFTPVMVKWLVHEYTWLNMSIRKKLKGPTDKAIHRFLSSQNVIYENEIAKIARTIGLTQPSSRYRNLFNVACNQLKELNWLEEFQIAGTGRKTPLRLFIKKMRK